MEKRIKASIYTFITGVFLFFLAGAVIPSDNQDPGEWVVPDRFKNLQNPVEMDTRSIRMGNSLFRRNCRDCHGSAGKGDGPEAADLKTTMKDFGSEVVQNQSDGELFYKTREGRDEMPGFEADLYDEDIWHLVNFIRSLEDE